MPDHLHPLDLVRRSGRRSARPWLALLVAAVAAGGAAAGPASAATDQQVADARAKAVAWIEAQQRADGSMGDVQGLDAGWSLLGLAGNGVHAADLRPGGNPAAPSAQDFYAGLWGSGDDLVFASSPGKVQASDYVRASLIANAAGIDPRRVTPTQNLTAKLARHWYDGTFQAPAPVTFYNQRVFGLLAMANAPVPEAFRGRTVGLIEDGQYPDGSYPVGLDMTGASIGGLCAAGRTLASPKVASAVAYLRNARGASGAIGNPNSTSWVLQGMGACGLFRGSAGWTADDERTIDWLIASQKADGSWSTSGNPSEGTNFYATQDALRALAPRPGFVVDPPARANPVDPVRRPVDPVAVGTPISVALAVDAGRGELRLCEVPTVEGATLRELLQSARSTATPAECVLSPRWEGGVLTTLNGRRTASSSGGWRWSVDGGVSEVTADETRTVSVGDVVSLRLVDPSDEVVPPDPDDPDPDPPTPDPDPDPPVDPPFVPVPDQPYGPPPGVPGAPRQPTAPTAPSGPTKRTTVRTACRRTSRNRAVRCTVRAGGRFTVTASLPGRKAVRKTARTRVAVVVRSPRAVKKTQRVRLRVAVGTRSRVITVRANGRTTVSRI